MRRMITTKQVEELKNMSETVDTTDDGKLKVNKGVIVNADNETISVTQEMKDQFLGNKIIYVSISDDDWDETKECYIRRINFNNTYIFVSSTGTHPFNLKLYCPHFRGLAKGYDPTVIDGFKGLKQDAGNRCIDIKNTTTHLAVFNGLVTEIQADF